MMIMDNELDSITEQKLIAAAMLGMQNAFTLNNLPEDFRFGAAVLTMQQNIYAAGQYFSDTYSLTAHAEQAALIHAAAHGEYNILAIAIIHNKSGENKTNPCHLCKQLLYENYLRSGHNIQVLLLNSTGIIVEKVRLLAMMPYPWPEKN